VRHRARDAGSLLRNDATSRMLLDLGVHVARRDVPGRGVRARRLSRADDHFFGVRIFAPGILSTSILFASKA
jgi:hypothetical protein